MLSIQSLFLGYGEKILFNDISCHIGVQDRIALVGSNGAGKTTFFKIIMGEIEPEKGNINRSNAVTLGYLPQDGIVASGRSVYEEVKSAFESVLNLQIQLQAAEEKLYELDAGCVEYEETLTLIGHIEHQLEDLEVEKMKSKIERVLMGLGFEQKDLERDAGEFSGGWQMRMALAKLLLQEPSLLLLDEPTNHLDIASQRWLEEYLKEYEGAIIMISHDRTFLNELCDRTFELSMGRLAVYEGNYDYYEEQKVQRKSLLEKAYKNQEKKLAQQNRFIERFRYKATKAGQVQSRIKMLEKMERIELEDEESGIGFRFPKVKESGRVVLELRNISKRYDEKEVIKGFTYTLEKGDRVAVVGVNGAGKSTLARMVAGVEPMTSGERVVGYNVQLAYFAQQLADELDPGKTVLETMEEAAVDPQERQRCRTILGAFLFKGSDVFKKVKVLSGGERCRLALGCMMVKRANCLIMDEPTNHLDMRSQDMLQAALFDYEGTLFIVSHNRGFLDPLVDKVLEVSREGVRVFLGNVSDYLEKIEEEKKQSAPASNVTKNTTSNSKEERKLKAKEREDQKELKKEKNVLEEKIQKQESQKKALEVEMMDPEFFKRGEETKIKLAEYHKLEAELEALTQKWVQLEEQLSDKA